MTVLAWYGIPSDCTSVERFEELKNAGFTHQFTEYPDAEAMARALDTAERVGIRLIVSCPELKAEPEATVRRFMNHPATAGYFLRDEPSADDFAELGAWAARIRATDDAHYCYLNLFPNYAPCETLKTDSYREYVNRFDREVPLQLLSFDHYPVVGDTCRPEWYENLEIFSDEARKAGKPFWAFALATAHEPYPIPDLAQLRLQVYSDLAYGAQGIQYFTYWTPEKNPTWDFHHAPVERSSGRRTDVYDKIKQMNAEIRALSGVFLGCAGALLLILVSRHGTGHTSSVKGDVLCLVSAVSYATFLTAFRNVIVKYSPVTTMKWMFLFAAVVAAAVYYRPLAAVDYAALAPRTWAGIGYVVVCSTFLSYFMVPIGQRYLRPTVVSMYNYVQPVVAVLFSVAIGLDSFGFTKAAAALCVFAGVWLVTKSKSRAQVEAEAGMKKG